MPKGQPKAFTRPTAKRRLTLAFLKTATPGTYGDGGQGSHGLQAHVTYSRNLKRKVYWRQRYYANGQRRSLGFGQWPRVSLGEAREKAAENHKLIQAGGHPLAANRKPKVPTFAQAVEKQIERLRPSWKAGSTSEREWRNSLTTYAYPKIGSLPITAIESAHIVAVLEPIWHTKRTLAKRVKERMHRVFDAARGEGCRKDNPVDGVDAALPKARAVAPKHHAALPYDEVAAAVAKVRAGAVLPTAKLGKPAPVFKFAFEFMVLTAARSGEVKGATWAEIDLEAALWVVPGSRMKGGKEHRVPLSGRAVEVLRAAHRLNPNSKWVFPSPNGKELSEYHFSVKRIRQAGVKATVHGFRSSFRDWAAEVSGASHAVLEAAIAHANPNKAEAAYHRTDYLDQRRPLMEAWAHYLGDQGDQSGKVVKLAARR